MRLTGVAGFLLTFLTNGQVVFVPVGITRREGFPYRGSAFSCLLPHLADVWWAGMRAAVLGLFVSFI
ncbi:hypothetical protein [Streptomyces sp. NPDC057909]|uniref:hypothetical protein n=1 Tax=Streptomyces sp. NPDC057909 TaxID=3346277 RepID=UPI0036E0ABBF